MKLITFTVPCYNSAAYMQHCIDTLLTGGDEVEIILVNDGSTDATKDIADAAVRAHPGIIRAVHKPNGGHGSGVNKGVELATGLYFKVVDSDDWVDPDALRVLLDTLRAHVTAGQNADLYITNFIYDHTEDHTAFVRSWRSSFPTGQFTTWETAKDFHYSKVLLMHALLYRTAALRDSGTVLPEHTFYVDNLFAYRPLPYMHSLFYLDVDLYHYFIGRSDQSVNIANITKRYEQQIRVMRLMADTYSYAEITALPKGLRKYMLHCLKAIMANTEMFTVCGGDTPERREALQALWAHIRERDEKLFRVLRHGYTYMLDLLPWSLRSKCMLAGYRVLCRFRKLG